MGVHIFLLSLSAMANKGLIKYILDGLETVALNRSFPFFVFFLGIILSTLLWQTLTHSQLAPLKSALQSKSTSIRTNVKNSIESQVLGLQRMALRWGERKNMPLKEWRADASAYIKDFPGLKAVQWADKSYHVRWVEPLKGNERAVNLNILFNRKREQILRGASKQGTITLTPPIRLMQGYKAFIAYAPIYIDGEFNGFIIGIFDINLTLDHYLGDLFSKDYHIRFYIDDVPAFQNSVSSEYAETTYTVKENFKVYDKTWALEITPTDAYLSSNTRFYPYWFLMGGALASLVLSLFINSLRTSRNIFEQAKDSELRFQLAVEGTQDGIWDWEDVTKPDVYWSPQCCRLLGYEIGEIENSYKTFWPLLHPEDLERTKRLFSDHFSKQVPFDINYRLLRSSGEYSWFHVQAVSIRDENSRVLRMVGSLKDINDRMLFETEQNRLIQMLTRSNAELDDFAYIASHDLKEPLRAIMNHSTFLLEDYEDKLDGDGVKKLNRLVFLSKRMEKLISDLLYFSRLGQEKPAIKVTDLNAIIDDLRDTMHETLAEKNAQILLPKPLPITRCDNTRTTELFRNLITNAIKYNNNDKKLVEIGHISGQEDVFYVKDNGIGIAPEMFEDVFRIFHRLNSESAFGEGTGVGLSFVKKIIERNGGKIWIESEPGEGTTFFFTFGNQPQQALSA